jgi:uncharacterized membrane protein YtjA (UPF0391 family)
VRVGKRREEASEAVAELRLRHRHRARIGARGHRQHVVVSEPDDDERRMQLPRERDLRDRVRAQWEAEDQELQDVPPPDAAAADQVAGEARWRDVVEHRAHVLAGDGKVARTCARVLPEADAGIGAPDLAGIESAVPVEIADHELRGDPGIRDRRQRKVNPRPPREHCGRTVDLTRGPVLDETTGAEAGHEAVADDDEPTEPRASCLRGGDGGEEQERTDEPAWRHDALWEHDRCLRRRDLARPQTVGPATREASLASCDARRGSRPAPRRRWPSACFLSEYAKEATMLSWALTFFVIALVAALLGFGNVAGLSAEFGWIFIVVAVIFLVVGLLSGRRGPMVP